MNFNKNLGDGFSVRAIDFEELSKIQNLHFKRIFANRLTAPTAGTISELDQEKINQRKAQLKSWELMVGLYHNDQAIGWHVGHATDPETYYMKNSVVIEEYRNQGLYSKMLKATLEFLKQEGFQIVTSIHHPNNAAVLIPKIKLGFIITASQFHERFKHVIELKYFFNSERRKAYGQAIGLDLN